MTPEIVMVTILVGDESVVPVGVDIELGEIVENNVAEGLSVNRDDAEFESVCKEDDEALLEAVNDMSVETVILLHAVAVELLELIDVDVFDEIAVTDVAGDRDMVTVVEVD